MMPEKAAPVPIPRRKAAENDADTSPADPEFQPSSVAPGQPPFPQPITSPQSPMSQMPRTARSASSTPVLSGTGSPSGSEPAESKSLQSATLSPNQTEEVGSIRQTEVVGGSGGFGFQVKDPQSRPVIGFRYAMGSWAGQEALRELMPIYDREAASAGDAVMAREGYVVSGLELDAETFVNAVRVHFARQLPGGEIDPKETYVSDWVGEKSATRAAVKLGGEGTIVLGVFGRRGAVLDALGLLVQSGSSAN
jgi:hypothetical protein